MTPQETFNIVKEHLLKQQCRALGRGGCAYRGAEGRKCAIGCLIPDDKYTPDLEGIELSTDEGGCGCETCGRQEEKRKRILQILHEAGHELTRQQFADLQTIHDNQAPEEWGERLAALEQEWFK